MYNNPLDVLADRIAGLERRLRNLERLDLPPLRTVSALVRLSAAQTLTTSSWQNVDYDDLEWDTDGMWDAANPSYLTVQTKGYYLLGCATWFAYNATEAARGGRVLFKGSEVAITMMTRLVGYSHPFVTVSPPLLCEVGDVIRGQAFQASGGDLDLQASTSTPYRNALWAVLVHAVP
jgi:hypothetical protein